ncbi:Uncharacterised protein r2_g2136 [Pycnogonum litorale]
MSGEDYSLSVVAEFRSAIKSLKCGRDAGEDEIRPEMLKALNGEGIPWLTRVCQKAWEYDQEVHARFVDLENAYDRVPRHLLWSVVQKYGIEGQLLVAVKSLHESPNV